MSRAHDLLPIPDRSRPEEPMPGMTLTDAHRATVEVEERFVPGPPGEPDVRLVITRPREASGPLPILFQIHGGAFCLMHPESFAAMEANWALNHRCIVVSVDYRLAPEHPFPAGPEDCYAAFCWVGEHVAELGGRPGPIVVTGASAGGALAAALTLMVRDRGGPEIAYQALMIPVTDDRLQTPSIAQADLSNPGFNGPAAEGMWLHYLGEDYDRGKTSPYAAPARATDFSDLPPAFIQTNGLDPLRDEGIQYALALLSAGIEVELYNCPGAYHGADPLDPRTAMRAYETYEAALHAALHPDA